MAAVGSQRVERGAYQRAPGRTLVHTEGAGEVFPLEQELAALKQQMDILRSAAATAESAARDEGYRAGFNDGLTAGRAEVGPAVARLNATAAEIETGLERVWEGCREAVSRLVLNIAAKIVGEAANNYADLAVQLTAECLSQLRDQTRVTVFVNPADAETVRSARVELESLTDGVRNVEIVPRAAVTKGGVIVATNAGQLDARLEEQLAAVRAALCPVWDEGVQVKP